MGSPTVDMKASPKVVLTVQYLVDLMDHMMVVPLVGRWVVCLDLYWVDSMAEKMELTSVDMKASPMVVLTVHMLVQRLVVLLDLNLVDRMAVTMDPSRAE
jgi:hypothetical protein